MVASRTPCVSSGTVSRSGQRVAATRRRRSASASSGKLMEKVRIASVVVVSIGLSPWFDDWLRVASPAAVDAWGARWRRLWLPRWRESCACSATTLMQSVSQLHPEDDRRVISGQSYVGLGGSHVGISPKRRHRPFVRPRYELAAGSQAIRRQGKTEPSSTESGIVVGSNVTVMCFNDRSRDRQAQTHAGVFGREETIEEMS